MDYVFFVLHPQSEKQCSNEKIQHGATWCKITNCTLLETNIAPENGWLEEEFSFWDVLFSGAMLVSRSVIRKKGATKNQQEHD